MSDKSCMSTFKQKQQGSGVGPGLVLIITKGPGLVLIIDNTEKALRWHCSIWSGVLQQRVRGYCSGSGVGSSLGLG